MNEVGAVFVTGAVAALIAIWGVLSQRAIARRQVTLDHISHLESDRDIIEARKRFVELSKEAGGLAKWAEADQEQTSEALAIGRILNSYELISIGIQRGIIDFELFKRWHRASAIKYWERGAPFVFRIRERLNNDMFFHEFEQMVGWFKGDKKPPKRRPGTFFKGTMHMISFTNQARHLAGLCGAVLGWRPDEFWAATPAEIATIFEALTPQADAAGDSALITTLQEQFPDG